jgi:lipopolysaccharide export system protein LptA
MLARIKRTAATFAIVLVAFSAYRVTAVPLIEPKVEKKRLASVPAQEREDRKQKQQDRLGGYARFFPPGSWELNDPMVLESDTSKLLLNKYTVRDDGRLEIKPCTVIGFPDGDAEDPASNRRVIIAQIPEGGVLQFDSPVDLKGGKLGKLVGAVFSGPVTIRSAATRPDGSDSLYVATHDVDLVDNLVTTAKDVDFQYGPSTGHGRGMRMQLLPAAGPPGKRGTVNIGGVQSIELLYDVTMHIVPGSSGMMPGDNRPGGMFPGRAIAGRNPNSPASRQPQPPLDIRCQGPFDFDMQSYVATFRDTVTVLRPNPAGTGPDDQLRNCDTLIVGFAPRETATPKSSAGSNQASDATKQAPRTGGVPPLETRWMKALGNPVTVDAPSNSLLARGQRLAYDVQTGRIELESTDEAFLHWHTDEARARSLMYQPGPGGAVLGLAESKGPGWMNVAVGDDLSRFEARWSNELKMRPQDDNSVVSLIGDASASFTGRGEISAPEIHVWLHETVPPPQDASARQNVVAGSRQSVIQPVKMFADGGVHIESPQLSGTIKRLEAVFRENEAVASQSSQPGARNAFSQSQSSASGQPRHYEIRRGELLQAWFINGPVAPRGRGRASPGVSENLTLDNVVLDGNVWFAESAHGGSEKPLEILGDKLQVDHATAADTTMLVVGRPAQVAAQGMTLFGPSVQMDRATNRLWIDGAGKITIAPNRPPQNPQAAPAVQQPQLGDFMTTNAATTVTWQQSMQFDGRTARFQRDVVAEQTEPDRTRTIHTPAMDVTLHDRVDFAAARLDRGQPNQQPVVELLACRGDVLLESRQTQGGGVIAFDRMNVRDLTVNRLTGELTGQGPGHVTGWHFGTAGDLGLQSGPASTGTNVRPVAARGPTADPRTPAADSSARSDQKQINFIGVQFQQGISGNVLPQHQQLVFHDQVRTIVGPVPTWDAQLDPDVVGGVPPGGTSINSDQLTVSEVELPPSAQRTAELDAEGNVEVEGQQQQGDLFMAQAHHLTYSQAKDLLILTGDGLSPARLDQRRTPTSPPYQTAAPKIEFWRSQRRVVAPNGVEYAEGRFNSPRPRGSGHSAGSSDTTR